MNFETALNFVNDAVAAKVQRRLRPPEIAIFRGTWQGMTYEQMANSSAYSANYLMRDIGPKFWKLLSDILGKNVGKNNLRVVLENLYAATSSQSEPLLTDEQSELQSRWQATPDLSLKFYGRETELNLLRQWTTEDRCRLIGLWGLSGAGKTVLLKKLAEQIQNEFEIVIWRSLAEAPTLSELVGDLAPSSRGTGQERGNAITQLLELMRSHSCAIFLDGIESIFQPGELSGKYRPGYENYGEMLQAVGESSHQSCTILSSLENPRGIFQVKQQDSPIRSFKLAGLSDSEAKLILETEGLRPSVAWEKLIKYYQGNPAILSIASKIITELFSGNVEEFLAQKSLVFGEIDRVLDRSSSRLSVLETEILYWLVSEPQPVSLNELQTSIPLSIFPVELIEAVESLNERSLLEIGTVDRRSVLIVPPAIRELVTNQFIAQIGREFSVANRQKRIFATERAIELNVSTKQPTQLGQWLQDRFEPEWQPVEVIFAASARSPARLRSAFNLREAALVKRFKQIELNTAKVLLLIAISQEDRGLKICAQAQPAPEQQTLPQNLHLSLLDASERTLAEIESEQRDNFIQLPYFRGVKTEHFKLKLTLNSASHQEEFII